MYFFISFQQVIQHFFLPQVQAFQGQEREEQDCRQGSEHQEEQTVQGRKVVKEQQHPRCLCYFGQLLAKAKYTKSLHTSSI